MPSQPERVDERASVEEEAFHRRVVDQEEVALTAEVADGAPVVLVEVAAGRHRRAHEQEACRLGPDDPVESFAVEAPPFVFGEEWDEGRDAACKADPVDDPRVGRVGDDHLVARVDQCEEDVEEALHAAYGDDDLAHGVVVVAGSRLGELGDRGAEIEVAGERQPAVCLRRSETGDRLRDGLRGERKIGVEVLHPQDRAAADVRGRRYAVDAEAANRLDSLCPPNHRTSLVRLGSAA